MNKEDPPLNLSATLNKNSLEKGGRKGRKPEQEGCFSIASRREEKDGLGVVVVITAVAAAAAADDDDDD